MKTDLLKRPAEITPLLRSVELNAAGDKAYSCYDGQGERVRKVVKRSGGVVEERRYMGGYEVYRKTLAGAAVLQRTTHNISDGSTTFCRMEWLNNTAPVLRYQYANHLGSASLELDAGGLLISYEEYRPFGTTSYRSGRTATEVSLKRYHYCGKERDEESGLYYYGARYYADWLGRFVSVDPLAGHPKNIKNNPYCYVSNNPINNIDPSGMIWDKTNKSDEKVTKYQEKLDSKNTAIDDEISVVTGILENTEGLSEKKIASYQDKLSNLKEKQLEVSNAITELAEMESKKDVIFRLEPTWNQPGNETYTNVGNGFVQEGVDTGTTSFKDGKVVMQYDKFSDDAMAHELKHGHQFLAGELSFDRKTGGPGLLYDLTDEQAAWKRGSLFSANLSDSLKEPSFDDLKAKNYSAIITVDLNVNISYRDLLNTFGATYVDNPVLNNPVKEFFTPKNYPHEVINK